MYFYFTLILLNIVSKESNYYRSIHYSLLPKIQFLIKHRLLFQQPARLYDAREFIFRLARERIVSHKTQSPSALSYISMAPELGTERIMYLRLAAKQRGTANPKLFTI